MKKMIIMAAALVLLITGCGKDEKVENIVEDGNYSCQVSLEGGSGKATVSSPAEVVVEDGQIEVTLVWSSSHYDYMLVDGVKYDNTASEGENSVFTIPVPAFDEAYTVIGDTTAMSTPHEIEYNLIVYGPYEEAADQEEAAGNASTSVDTEVSLEGLTYVSSLELEYATEFSVDFYEDAQGNTYNYITIGEDDYLQTFLQLQKGADPEADTDNLLKTDATYLVSSSVMDLIISIDALDQIRFTGTDAADWSLDEAKEAVESGDMLFAGKYSAPDYELLLANGCTLAIENTMIYHNPEVLEKLKSLGIDVLIERSSYENSPLGRLEWIKLYGVLFDRLEEGVQFFEQQTDRISAITSETPTGLKVAFFSITSNGSVTVRKPGDYISAMIEMAGGIYVPEELGDEGDNKLSTMTITMEDFYLGAYDADLLIYNGTIEGDISGINELLDKAEMLSEFKAVQEGNVYCLPGDYFQQSTKVADFIEDVRGVLTQSDSTLNFLYKLED